MTALIVVAAVIGVLICIYALMAFLDWRDSADNDRERGDD